MKTQLVVFDMAGTTVDEDNLVYKTVRKAVVAGGYDVDLETVLRFAAGKEKKNAIADVLAHLNGVPAAEETVAAIHQNFKKLLAEAYLIEPIQPQPGAEQVFAALQQKNIKVVLNTGYDRTTANQLLKRLGWEDQEHIDLVITASDVQQGRPDPAMIELAMQKLAIEDAATVVKIGDSTVDIEEGINAGCGMNLGITTGAHTKEQLQAVYPTAIVDSLEEMLDLLD